MNDFRLLQKEPPETGNKYRKEYLDGVDKLILDRYEKAKEIRKNNVKNVFENPEECRDKMREMLGWPLVDETDKSYTVKKEFVREDNGVKIYRVQITILGCLPVYGMMFITDESPDAPMIIAAHGGLGAPELCAGLLEVGTINYNHMVERVLNYKVNIFAPQFLNWNIQRFKVADEHMEVGAVYEMRIARDRRLQQLGSSITALEIFGVQRAIDYLIESGLAREDKIGMLGLSYGGFYTLFTAALDTRIKASLSCSFFNDRVKRIDFTPDWTWKNAANTLLDAEILSLIYPRKIDICVGKQEELFDINDAIEEFDRFKVLACDKADFATLIPFEGQHEFIKDDSVIETLIKRVNEE